MNYVRTCILCTSYAVGVSAPADIIAGYDFDGGSGNPTTISSNLSATPLTSPMAISFVASIGDNSGLDGAGVPFGDTGTLGAIGIGVNDATTGSFANAVSGNEYLSFTLTPDSRMGMRLESISFKATKRKTTSVDTYAIADAQGNLIGEPVSITTLVGLTGTYESASVDLTGTAFEVLTEATEFRIYAWGRGTSNTSATLAGLDKITVDGAIFNAGGDAYVATNGSDSNSGSRNQPLASVQYALDTATPGDTIFVRGGNYHEEIDLSGVAGTTENPITITAFNNEAVTLNGTKPITANWTRDSGNVYKTTLAEDITQLFVDEQPMTLARFPNALVWSDEMWKGQTKKQNNSGRGRVDGADIVGDAGVSFEGCIGMFNFGNFETIISRVSSHTAGSNTFNYSPSAGIYRTSDGYFLEGGVGNAERAMLDMAQEWAYDETTKTLYLWADDGRNPNGREIAGQTQKFAITGDADTKNIVIDGVDFFATTFKFVSSDGITIQNCDSLYHTTSDRALGSIATPEPASITGSENDFCEDLVFYNNTFRYSVTAGLVASFLENPRIENNRFEDINYTCAISASVQTSQTRNLINRRNTLINSGPTAGFRFGRFNSDAEIQPFVLEYNYAEKCSRLQDDGTAFYSASAGLVNSVWRFNWAYDNHERDFRFDGQNNPLTGVDANIYRNVSHTTQSKPVNILGGAYRLKGDFHEIYNNVSVLGRGDFEISLDKGGNANSQTINNAGDFLAGSGNNAPIPGTASNNHAAQNEARGSNLLLRNTADFDYRPKADAVELIDQGAPVTAEINGQQVNVTAGFKGAAPDIGAYEFGDENYTIPGYQAEKASRPIPSDGNLLAKYDSDLMWLGGLEAVSHEVYLGTAAGSLSRVSRQSNNIFTPEGLENDRTYFWRVDSVLANGSVIRGEVWTFKIDDHAPRAKSLRLAATEDAAKTIQLEGFHPDGAALTYQVTSAPRNGSLSGTAPNLGLHPKYQLLWRGLFPLCDQRWKRE